MHLKWYYTCSFGAAKANSYPYFKLSSIKKNKAATQKFGLLLKP